MNYYVTFGQRWRSETHPQDGHPDGWFRIVADTELQAFVLAHAKFGDHWAFMYTENLFDKKHRRHYPKGELGVIQCDNSSLGAEMKT